MAKSTKERKGTESFTVEGSFEEIKSDTPFIKISFTPDIELESNLSSNLLKEILIDLANAVNTDNK